jgi:SM-20-related protein
MMPDSSSFKNSLPQASRFDRVSEDLDRSGFASMPHFLDAAGTAALGEECRAWNARGSLQASSIGRGEAARHSARIRSDTTAWFDTSAPTAAQEPYWTQIHALRQQLNRSLLLGLDDVESHYAIYAPGASYSRHRDRFRDEDTRVLSSVFYLNDDWTADQGGALRIHLDPDAECRNPHVDIYPEAGTLAIFLSAPFEHEVLVATRDRLSIAGWFRQRSAALNR